MARRSERGPEVRSARVTAGDVVLRFGGRAGARAERVSRPEPPRPAPAPAPEGPFPEVVDRIDAIERAGTALVAGRPVLLHGPPGAGKTTLLKHLSRTAAHDAPDGAGAWPDGTVLLSARGRSAGDALQALHRALHRADGPYHASPRQIENGLRDRQALVLIDDVELPAEAVESILAAAPGCAFALGSESDLEGLDLARVEIGGLDPEPGIELLVLALGRDPTPLEAARIRELHRGLEGRPLRILQTAALLHGGAVDLEQAARLASSEDPLGALAARLEESLTLERLRALLALEAVAPAGLSVGETASIAELEDAGADLEALAHRGLARVDGARYRAAGGLGDAVAARNDRATWRRRALDHLAARAAGGGEAPEALEWAFARAVEDERRGDAVAIARAVAPALAVDGRWEAWGAMLEQALEAALDAGDREGEAWALHERGTRALALGEVERAVHDLERAVEIRERLGDDQAAAASRRNLAVALDLDGVPAPVRRARGRGGLTWALLAVALVVIAAIAWFALLPRNGAEAVDAGSVRFEDRPVGREALAPVLVANDGEAPATIGAVALAGARPEEFSIVRDGCSGEVVRPGARCGMVLGFRPAGVGDRSATLVVPFEGAAPRAVALSGLGVPGSAPGAPADADAVVVAPGRLDFGRRPLAGDAEPRALAIVNRTSSPARVAVRVEPAGGPFSVADDPCTNAVLPPGASCVLQVGFAPREPGVSSGTLVVRGLGTAEDREVPLTGTGEGTATGPATVDTVAPADTAPPPTVAASGLAADAGSVDFGAVPPGSRSDVRSVVVRNPTDAAIDVATVRLAGLDAAVFTIVTDRCSGGLLSPGGRCAIDVAFEPAEDGGWSARLEIRDPTGDGPDVELAGSGG